MNAILKHKQELTYKIQLAECLKRLTANTDFVILFKEYYCNTLVLENVTALANYDKDSLEYQELINELNQISYFQKFMDTILTNGVMAKDNLRESIAILDTGENDE